VTTIPPDAQSSPTDPPPTAARPEAPGPLLPGLPHVDLAALAERADSFFAQVQHLSQGMMEGRPRLLSLAAWLAVAGAVGAEAVRRFSRPADPPPVRPLDVPGEA
jgi:hypothetical protein